jgi:hypothetical protein
MPSSAIKRPPNGGGTIQRGEIGPLRPYQSGGTSQGFDLPSFFWSGGDLGSWARRDWRSRDTSSSDIP